MLQQNKIDVYTIVTNRIIEHLEKGVVPWRQPWTDSGLPKNLITGKPYRGINVWLLSTLKYPRNFFLTLKQANNLGGVVKKGEKANEVVFWKWLESQDKETGETKKTPLLRYYKVFNVAQCEGIPEDKIPQAEKKENPPLETCEKIIKEMPKCPKIQFNEQSAYYNKAEDFLNMPKMETFTKSEDYYSTLFHELVHSTGHNERLNRRELIESRGMRSNDYAIEELTAEMGASYLNSYAGIPIEQLDNNAAYINGWLERLKQDKRFVVYASSHAQRATDFILDIMPKEKEPDRLDAPSEKVIVDEERTGQITKVREKLIEGPIGLER
jgi:antirestriction protein ArdC